MGAPFNDEPRDYRHVHEDDIRNFLLEVKDIATSSKLTVDQVLKAYEIKELERKNSLFVEAGDKYDETMIGFADLFSQVNLQLELLRDALPSSS